MESNRKRAILGVILVIIGAVFLIDNLGYDIDLPWYVFRWPAVFIIIGIVNILSGNLRPAFIFFGLGVLFYLDVFGILPIWDFWPLILIIIGALFILKTGSIVKTDENSDEYFDEIAIFGGTDKKFNSQNFKGGKITSVFGGSKINLRGSQIANEASIELFCMFGGAEILVPDHWKVNMNATAIFGGLSDERTNISPEPTSTLHIKGFVMFGGGEMKN